MTGYRRAAVALHALDEGDRRWILSELPEGDRVALTGYLDELASLGFTNDEHFAEGVSALSVESPGSKKPDDLIRRVTAIQMATVLANEPSSLVAQLLAVQEWPWAASFLKMLTPLRRERIRSELAGTARVTPARAGFLITAIAGRLENVGKLNSAPSRRNWLQFASDVLRRIFSPLRRMVRVWKR